MQTSCAPIAQIQEIFLHFIVLRGLLKMAAVAQCLRACVGRSPTMPSRALRRKMGATVAVEIERKYLVTGTNWRQTDCMRLSQGYLNRDKERTVRVRIAGAKAFLTIKGITQGASRVEFEYEVPLQDAEHMLALCEGPVVEKFRHIVRHQGLIWEVDEFLGENLGLVVAEVELEREDQPFEKPQWVGSEVTNDPRYYNSNLATHPYSAW